MRSPVSCAGCSRIAGWDVSPHDRTDVTLSVLKIIVGPSKLLLLVLEGLSLVNAGPVVGGIPPEGDVQVLQECIHASEEGLRGMGSGILGGCAIIHNHTVCKVGSHDEIVLHDECRLLAVHDESLDHLSGNNTLLGVQVGGGLVDEVHVGGHAQAHGDGHSLQLSSRQVLHLLVHQLLNPHGLHHVGHELGVHVRVADALVQQVAHGASEFGADLLGLVRDVEAWHLHKVVVRLQHARQQPDEGRLACSILPQHNDNLGVCEGSLFHIEHELGATAAVLGFRLHGGLHGGVLVQLELLGALLHVLRRRLRHLEGERLLAKPQVLCGYEARQEDVDALPHTKGHGDDAVGSGLAV
mmetsp:Transcript_9373/g.28171  ORF Transcript_9373/g.28171 Transcript_9373/m.28171 type:complete len:354 (+) Transcript_9373:2157-3218(+)